MLSQFAVACHGSGLFALPTWYMYLDCQLDANDRPIPRIVGINNIWLIIAAVIDMLLRVAAVVAIGFVIYGGVMYISSQGQPDKVARARTTIVSSIAGLVIAVAATALITFIAHTFN